MKEFMGIMYPSLDPKGTEFERFCNSFVTKVKFRRAERDKGEVAGRIPNASGVTKEGLNNLLQLSILKPFS